MRHSKFSRLTRKVEHAKRLERTHGGQLRDAVVRQIYFLRETREKNGKQNEGKGKQGKKIKIKCNKQLKNLHSRCCVLLSRFALFSFIGFFVLLPSNPFFIPANNDPLKSPEKY